MIDTSKLNSNDNATKADVKVLHEDLRTDLAGIKTDFNWIKKFMFAVGLAVVIAAIKYIIESF